ncbi:MAG: hypothetical protein P1P84_12470 [Deferrisomatales bacterium]|nr:hypothetical protein [Deferrisomatales bacterium]
MAVFIPFAIVFLSDLLDSGKARSTFEKMVLNDEVLGTKRVFWLSITGIAFFAFFSGTDVPVAQKVFSLTVGIIIIATLWRPFRNILRFADGHNRDFELAFLRKLRLTQVLTYRNNNRCDKLVRAWESCWTIDLEQREREFTEVFIMHVDACIARKHFVVAVQLAQIYIANIAQRQQGAIGDLVLPKLLIWDRQMRGHEQQRQAERKTEGKLREGTSSPYFPTFYGWALSLWTLSHNRGRFWQWNFYHRELLQAVVKALLSNAMGPYKLFDVLAAHIYDYEAQVQAGGDSATTREHVRYVSVILDSFCSVFFQQIEAAPASHDIWNRYFPEEWKITADNYKNTPSRILCGVFVKWALDRMRPRGEEFDKDLSEVINGLFPKVDQSLFPAFLLWLFTHDIKATIKRERTFHIMRVEVSFVGDGEKEDIERLFNQAEKDGQRETVAIIVNYFNTWEVLSLYKENLSEEQHEFWEAMPQEDKKKVLKDIRLRKLAEAKATLESTEIIEMCEERQDYEYRRNDLVALVDAVTEHLEA